MNKFKAIEVFKTVVDANGFAAAARRLNMSAPSVTRIIKSLEDDLGVLLIKRTTRKFALTNTGQHFFEDCMGILNKLSEAEASAKSAYSYPVGHLRISASVVFGTMFVMPVITDFISGYPGITVRTVFTDKVIDLVEENVDVAIRIGNLKSSSLNAKKIASVSWVLCASPSYLEAHGTPRSIQDLAAHNAIDVKIDDVYFNWKFKEGQSLDPQGVLSVNSVLAAKSAVLAGWGLTQLLSYQVAREIEAGELVAVMISEMPAALPVNIVHAEGQQASAKIGAFVDFAAEAFRSNRYLSR